MLSTDPPACGAGGRQARVERTTYRAGLPRDEDGRLPEEGEHVLEALAEGRAVVVGSRARDEAETRGVLRATGAVNHCLALDEWTRWLCDAQAARWLRPARKSRNCNGATSTSSDPTAPGPPHRRN